MLDLNIDVYVPAENGQFVSETHARIAEILQDYDPTINLAWIPPDKREPGDQPFAVVKTEPNGYQYIICYSDTCDERLLARVWSMDSSKHDVLGAIEAQNAAREALKLKKEMEEAEERQDLVGSIIRGKHYYKHNGVTYQ